MASPGNSNRATDVSRSTLLASTSSSSSSSSSSSPSTSSSSPSINLFGSWNPNSASPHYPSSFSSHDLSSSDHYYGVYGQPQHSDYSVASDLSALSDSSPVYRSVSIQPTLSRSWDQQPHTRQSPYHTPSLDQFDSYPARFSHKQLQQLSLNPKHEQSSLDYTVLSPSSPVTGTQPPQALNVTPVKAAPLLLTPSAPPAGYLGQHHFFIPPPHDHHTILQQLHTLLVAKGVDCLDQPETFSIKAEAYRNSITRVEFKVCLFFIGDDRGQFAVELQRRFGDCPVFYRLFLALKNGIEAWLSTSSSSSSASSSSSSASSSSDPLPSPSSSHPSLPVCPPLDLPDSEIRVCSKDQTDVLTCLTRMCESDCVDVKCVAMEALAELSAKPEYKKCMMAAAIPELFIASLPCSYPDIHRCALTGLANLLSCKQNISACNAFIHCEEAKAAIQRLVGSKCPQVVRECARSLACLAATLKEGIKDDHCVQQCVRALTSSNDQAVQQQLRMCTETLAAAQ